MELLAPSSLVGLVLVPAVFLWGLLAPRGRRVVVGSLLLWKRALGGGPAGKPSARVRLRDPLLWLDALLVLLVVVALARPAVRTAATLEPVVTLVIDRTASMGAWAGAEHGRRCDRARAMMADVLGALGDSPIRLILVPDDSNAVLAGQVTAEEFRRRFVGTCGFVLASPGAPGLPVALAEAAHGENLPVVFVTDVAPRQKVPENVYVLATGGESCNAGLQRVAVREGWLLVSAKAAPDAPGSYDLHVFGDTDRPILTERSFLAPGETVERILELPGPAAAGWSVKLDGPPDGFQEDNSAGLTLEPAGPLRILLVGDAPASMGRVLAACGDTTVMEAPAGTTPPPGEVDLVVAYASALPADWKGPAAMVLPPEGAVPARRETDQEAAAEWRVAVDHPLADALYLEPPRLGPVRRYALDDSAELLLGTRDVSLIVTWEAGGARRLAVLFGFDEAATDWPTREGFPVFWKWALDWLAPSVRSGEGGARSVSFIGSDEGFQAGPGRDDSRSAVEAIRRSIEARRRATFADLWPYLAAAVVAGLLVRSRVAR
jgi:hypothetical protein